MDGIPARLTELLSELDEEAKVEVLNELARTHPGTVQIAIRAVLRRKVAAGI